MSGSDGTGLWVVVLSEDNPKRLDPSFVLEGDVMMRSRYARPALAATLIAVLAFVLPANASEPQALRVLPPTAPRGAVGYDITVTGASFMSGATLSFSGTGITVQRATVNAQGSAVQAKIDVAQDAPLGAQDVVVTNRDGGSSTCADCLEVTAGPTIASIDPDSLRQGDQHRQLVISGDKFNGVAQITFTPGGISVNTIEVQPPTGSQRISQNSPAVNGNLIVDVTVASVAAPGPRTVTILTTDGARTSCMTCFSITGQPIGAHSVKPSSRGTGAYQEPVTIFGRNFAQGATVRFVTPGTGGTDGAPTDAGITVDDVTVADPRFATATVTIETTAPAGVRDVIVANTDGSTATCSACFIVNAGPAGAVPAPPLAPQGAENVNVTLTGANFTTGARALFLRDGEPSDDVRVIRTVIQSAGAGYAQVSIALDGDTTTPLDVAVRNPDGGRGVCLGCFTITPAPRITGLSPNSLTQGKSATLQISGTDITGPVTVSFSGGGIAITGQPTPAVNGSFAVNVTVGGYAPTGARDVIVKAQDGGRGVCVGCLQIDPQPPVVTQARPNIVNQSAEAREIQIIGRNFDPGSVVSFNGPDDKVHVDSAYLNVGTLLAEVTVEPDAAPGPRDIVVTNSLGTQALCERCFTVGLAPQIAAVAPNAKGPGASNQDVVVSGTGFIAGARFWFSGTNTGMTVHRTNVISPTQAVLTISIAGNATPGARTLAMRNPDLTSAACSGCFTVLEPVTIPKP